MGDYATNKFSAIAGATFSSTMLYAGVGINSTGHVVLGAGTTDNSGLIVGTLYSVTATTVGAGVESVLVGWGPVIKVRLAASTLDAGNTIGFSTLGLGIVPTTDSTAWGVILSGSSGGAGRVVEVVRTAG
jgi:hypothetical protein